MDIFATVLLGVIQGLTEFLPISSTGHLILVRDILGIDNTNALAFDAVLHLATALAVVWYFRTDLWLLLQTALRRLGRLPVNERDASYINALIIATVPAVILGLFLESAMETYFRSPLLVAGVLVLGSVLFAFAEWRAYDRPNPNNEQLSIDTKRGLKIGLFQSLALLPGMSRSGASIAGGMLMGLTRHEAARFAFLLAIPIMIGAGGKKLIELLQSSVEVPWLYVAIGASIAFVTGLFAIHFMLGFVRRHTLWPFIWYRVLLALVVVLFVYFG